MATGQIATLPDNGCGCGIEPRRSVTPEVNIDRIVLQHRAWRSIRVDRVSQAFRGLVLKEQLVMNDTAAARVDRIHKLSLSVSRGGGQPESAVADCGSGVAGPFQFQLPGDVLAARFVPLERHTVGIARGGTAVVKGAVTTRPGEFPRRER